ncbi:GNAT family N-acetyltransferase [bacterium]|nr:MAG: GNAT family N-acetyltransferase [bacterium]
MKPSITIKECIGEELIPYINDLAKLRIEIFHDFPYLYEGSLDYEKKYLQTYASCEQAYCALVFDGDQVIGATTGIPLLFETDEVKRPFVENGFPLESVFYFGESILKKEYRGMGLGIRFFKLREAYASTLTQITSTSFCGVIRPDTHPMKPEGYQPLNVFWQRMGYEKQEGMLTEFSWKDIGETQESKKPMQFWMKSIK